ncbi:SDR family oxidoreductase [Zunongwangia profunda]|uniref:Short chain dehydrogenase n=1 Tax=Zunongwangia profunda (strain DSM 18752 / CCTCC AB 206139 / SM-A87) TaxID=655815 RepID=D5BKZ7_ZUNPS|nr:SDR family oxidoreductase [Zunongwangia profunda]ADF51896.1 short chain dehydrogenase [Zunongwangia profunda SM-A87]MAS73062.1 NAD(P)-dependent oxidoreductase [Zunongwangia sp.]|tara:strand:+ start:2938 stop:3675 length:738 start_codon:yes stop_codon:yes gene_type:complete
MKKVLITGANKSIGFETARQLLQQGYYVYLGSRSIERGNLAVQKLKDEGLINVELIQLDVNNSASVDTARIELGKKTDVLDILINNAGINGGMPQNALNATIEQLQNVLNTNLYGVVRVTQAFIDLLRKSENPRIVNVSSSGCSLTLHSDPTWKYYDHKSAVYAPSKAAMNMYTIALAYELKNDHFKVNAVCPGFVATDFNGHRGTGTAQEAGTRIVKYATIDDDGPTGKFFSEEYNPETGECPW